MDLSLKKVVKNRLFATLLALYFLLLVVNINAISLVVGDEVTYSSSVSSMLTGVIDSNNHPLLAKSIWAYIVFLFQGYFAVGTPLVWRLGTIIFSLGCLLIFYKILRLFFKSHIALLGCTLLALDPMYFVFSWLMQLDVISLFFALLTLYFLLVHVQKGGRRTFVKSGFFLGMSLAAKLSLVVLLAVIPIFVLLINFRKAGLKKVVIDNLTFLLIALAGFTLGNLAFFIFTPRGTGFASFALDLFKSQLGMPKSAIGYLNSMPQSWFTVPQMMTLYRVDWGNFVESILIFQNPAFFISTLIIVFASLLFVVFGRLGHKKEISILLLFFFCQYLPWFFNIHMTFYYYIVPLIPLIIIMFLFLIGKTKYFKGILWGTTLLSLAVFVLAYPLLVGLRVSKSYEMALFKYSRYNFTPRDTIFCQNCSPRK